MKKPFSINPIRFAFKRAGAETVYNDLVAPFFKLSKARAFLAASVATNMGVVGVGVFVNNLFGKFIDHLTTSNAQAFHGDIKIFCVAAGVTASLCAFRALSNESMKLAWRDWSREKMVGQLCSSANRGGFVQASNGEKDQAGERIVNDVATMVNSSTYLSLEGLKCASDVLAFSIVLFKLSPVILASVATLSVVGLTVSQLWSKKMQRVSDDITCHSNNFRNAIVETTANKQKIEFWRGESAEVLGLKDKREKLTQSVKKEIRLSAGLGLWTSIIGSASRLTPYVIAGNAVLEPNSATSVGKLTEIAGASGFLTNSTSWFLSIVPQKNNLVAAVKRLEAFLTCSKSTLPDHQIPSYVEGHEAGVQIRQLALGVKLAGAEEPRMLCEPLDLDLRAGDRLAVTGASGSGRTTFLRQLAGVMPHLEGSITYIGLKGPNEALFVPQDSHIPDFSFSRILSYPSPAVIFTQGEMTEALNAVGLGHFTKHLKDEEKTGRAYAGEMSGGEKQRLSFARLLLHKPKVIGLDEATSALHERDRVALYQLLIRHLPESIIISTIHNKELIPIHSLEGKIKEKRWILTPTHNQPIYGVTNQKMPSIS